MLMRFKKIDSITKLRKDSGLIFGLAGEVSESMVNHAGFMITISAAVEIGIKRYRLLNARSDRPITSRNPKAANAAKRKAYGRILTSTGTILTEFCFMLSSPLAKPPFTWP
jgi:hypothetical protein